MSRAQALILTVAGLLALLLLGGFVWLIWGQENRPDTTQATVFPSIIPSLVSSAVPEVSPSPVPANAATEPVVASQTPLPFDPLSCLPAEEGVKGQVIEVLPDAVLRLDLGKQIAEVKLLGVDPAGSGGQVLGLLRDMAGGKEVRLLRDAEETDAAGRLLRYVLVGEEFLNYELVRRGAALPALYPPGQACSDAMFAAEELARSENLGYWSQQNGPRPTNEVAATPAGLACDCAVEYQCSNFSTRRDAQNCYNACGDYRNVSLDDDKDGLACEQLP